MTRRRVSSGTEWEERVGYSRAVRTGDTVRVAGTTAVDEDGEPMTEAGPAAQTERALEIVGEALAEADAALSDVVRTRLYVTDADDWEAVGRAHGRMFEDVRPATTLVEVAALIEPGLVVEVEATAVVE
ncbi:Rid family hydrolase [Halobaculum sp. MBLA0147]|uniref:Rid family hydrolase n=1 Tax=Halobaculum sp. MBLA0147 TaxID=3079934 RepID=UPI00352386C6